MPLSITFFVERKPGKATEDLHKAAKRPCAKPGTPPDTTGPIEADMDTQNLGRVSAFVVGAFGVVVDAGPSGFIRMKSSHLT